jgi:alkanesulfonate monooxygenase SsuD/methylene tetrahydromethanopterin reductase-like flavin-dependent oxidoreductase (luciferase family)
VVTVVVPHSKGLVAAARRGWKPITANFLQPMWARTHWPMYEQGCGLGGHPARREDWRVCKSIFVAEDEETARRYAKSADGPYGFYFWNLYTKRKSAKNFLYLFLRSIEFASRTSLQRMRDMRFSSMRCSMSA